MKLDPEEDVLSLSMKAILGEELSEEEKLYLQKRNAKYELVRYLYMEKMEHEKTPLKNFQFSPGEEFMSTPAIDIVNALIEINEKTKSGEYKPMRFEDLKLRENNPPKTGQKKKKLL